MGSDVENPFEEFDLDPRDGIEAITQRLKELAEDAKDDAERERIRAAWEELTLHPVRRLRAALFAHPESRPRLGLPPLLPRRVVTADGPPDVRDLALRPSLLLTVEERFRGGGEVDAALSLDEDPVLAGLG